MNESNKYPMTLYLNQKYVFDVLAMMEDGFSQLRSIKATESEQRNNDSKVSGQVGISNAFAFLGMSLGGEREAKTQTGKSHEEQEERVHTPNSLFAKMRSRLYEQGAIELDLAKAQTGNFVEFKIKLQKNPLVDALERLRSVFRMSSIAENSQVVAAKKQNSGAKPQTDEQKQIAMIENFLNELDQGALDLIGQSTSEQKTRIVLTMDRAFIADISLSDLIDGEFTVLGKITNVIGESDSNTINLLRKTSFGLLPKEVFADFQKLFQPGVLFSVSFRQSVH